MSVTPEPVAAERVATDNRAPFTFASAINAYVEQHQSIHPKDERWHPSAIWGCGRQAIYSYRGIPETNPRDYKSKRTLWLGTQIHEWLQAAVAEHPEILECYSEVHIDIPELNIVGDADVLYRTSAGWELGEVKSIGTFALKNAQRTGLPKDDHRKQAMTYLYALRKYGSVAKKDCDKHPANFLAPGVEESTCPVVPPLGGDLPRICFAYIEKDNLQPHEEFVRWQPSMEQEIREKVEYLSTYANDTNSLPPRLPFAGKNMDTRDWRCRYCPWADRCWGADPDEIEPEASVW